MAILNLAAYISVTRESTQRSVAVKNNRNETAQPTLPQQEEHRKKE